MTERLGTAGAGAIAAGLAAVAATRGEAALWARTAESAGRAEEQARRIAARLGTPEPALRAGCDPAVLDGCTFVVEAIVEDHDAKAALLRELHARLAPDAILATTTSSLSVEALAAACGRPDRFVGLHVFNPVHKMELVELVLPAAATADTRERALALCAGLGKTVVEVPDTPGFVVNALLFPYLFDAVRLLERTGLEPGAVDRCMCLGAGHPLGPLALLDLVGLDVAAAIGEQIGADVPERVRELVAGGALGRKSGRGFHDYATA